MVLFSRNLVEFDVDLPLCNTQQGYSPPGEGKTFATGLKIYKVGFAGRSFAYAADDALTLLRIHSGTLYNARAACKMV